MWTANCFQRLLGLLLCCLCCAQAFRLHFTTYQQQLRHDTYTMEAQQRHKLQLSSNSDIEISSNDPTSSSASKKWLPEEETNNFPAPFNALVDVNLETRAVVYEVQLSKELGFDILQGYESPVVGEVCLACHKRCSMQPRTTIAVNV